MRSVVVAMMALIVVGCSPPSIGSYPDDDEFGLPRSRGQRGDADDEDEGEPIEEEEDETGGPRSNGTQRKLTITLKGSGSVTSTPAGVTCSGATCTGSFPAGTTVTLVATPDAGSVFAGWSGQCSGPGSCSPILNNDIAVTAEFTTLDGTWSGTYSNLRPAHGCNFNNTGNVTMTLTTGGTPQSSVSMTGLEIRQTSNCAVVDSRNGSSSPTNVTITGTTMTGNWPVAVQGIGGTLDFPFTATIKGSTITGTWTCTGCTGSFTLTKQ